jgi:hypothetical protein
MFAFDAQAALGFVLSQQSHIEAEVYRTKYAGIQYPQLIPVDFSANPFVKSVTYFSQDEAGAAEWINGNASDIPLADIERSKFETAVHTAGIGYAWGFEEVGNAQQLGINLGAEKAMAARRASEQFIDRIALLGDADKGFQGGLFNYPTVTAVPAATGDWATATPDQIIGDVNQALTNVQTQTNNIILADTLLLPYAKWNVIASRRLTDTGMTILEFIRMNNVYTAQTGNPLTIRGERRLDTAGLSGTTRMVGYRRSPEVMKLHIPMPHQFLPVFQQGGLRWEVPGVMRLGGLDIRLPEEVSYVDGI